MSHLLASSVSNVSPPWLYAIGQPLLGGMLIGTGAALLLATLGRIAGISGLLGGLLPPAGDNRTVEVGFRMAFLAGLLLVGFVAHVLDPKLIANDAPRSLAVTAVAGLAVGFGTRLGNGCTSGHGVCGISRLSPRSIVATLTFVTVAALTLLVVKGVGV
jgi:uncharacterized protein